MTLLATLIVVAVVCGNWYATWQLLKLRQIRPDLEALEERTLSAFVLSAVLTIGLVLSIAEGSDIVDLGPQLGVVIWTVLFVAAGSPALYWLWVYRHR